MKAVVYTGKQKMEVKDVEKSKIQDPRDAILRVTSAAICGSDLHMYDGRTDMEPGRVFGHEIMGIIDEVGDAVTSLKTGDRVVLPFNIACGFCMNCTRGFTNACLTANPDGVAAGYGYADMGPYQGGQAQYVRVPFAEFNAVKLPGEEGDEFENDFLLLSDIFPTGYHGAELAKVQTGSTVAVFGAGPVGLMAAMSSILKGASEVYIVDRSEERLAIAEEMGAIPISFADGDPAEQIMEIRKNNPLIQASYKPGEEKMSGVMCGIDAVGYQARSIENPDKSEDPMAVMKQLAKVVNPTGNIGIVGVYMPQDPEGIDKNAKEGMYLMPWGQIFEKGIAIGMGQTPVKKYVDHLRDLIIAGKAKPSVIVSHTLKIEDAPEAYKLFDLRGMGEGEEYTKIVLNP